MNEQLKNDLTNIDTLLEKVKVQGLDFLKNIEERQTSTKLTYFEHRSLNETGLGGQNTLKLFNEKFENLIVGSTGSRYWGFVTGGSTPASIMGDWLTTIYDQNTNQQKGKATFLPLLKLKPLNYF